MNNTEFIYWLQGMLEYTDVNNLSEDQAKVLLSGIKDHLKLVMKKVTPELGVKVVNLPSQDEVSKQFWENVRKSRDADIAPQPQDMHKPYWLDKYVTTKYDPSPWKSRTYKPGEPVC